MGVDIMLTKKGNDIRPILIECNLNPGFSAPNNTKTEKLHARFFKCIDDNVLAPILGKGKKELIEDTEDNKPLFSYKF